MRVTDRVRRRQRVRSTVDRVSTALVVVLGLIAAVTLLPASSQQRITALGCRVATVGLTDCVSRLYTPPVVDLRAMPLCETDGVLEQMVPTVEVQRLRFPQGGELERWVGRDGTIRVVPRTTDGQLRSPSVTDPGPWPELTLLGGVTVPEAVQWAFPGGEGESAFVADLQQLHSAGFQDRSALALFTGRPDTAPASLEPTTTLSTVPAGALAVTEDPPPAGELRTGQVAPTAGDVRLLHDRTSGTVHTTVPLAGTSPEGDEAVGWLRWGRDGTGRLVELLATVLWDGPSGAEVTHLHLPLAAGDEVPVEAWLTSSAAVLDTAFLRAEVPTPRGRMEQLVAAAGTVVTETRLRQTASLEPTLGEHLALDRRIFGDLSEERVATAIVRPLPSGGERARLEVTC